jgi:FkbM family methyltransferase
MIKVKDYYIPADDSHYLDYFKRFDHYQESQRNRSLAQVLDWRLAIDIGANIGLWSRDLSEYFDKTICFEPNKNCIQCLEKNINKKKSVIYNLAIGSDNTEMDLYTPVFSGGSSFVNQTNIGLNKDGSTIYGEFSPSVSKQKTQIKTLDSYNFQKVDFIKIDVQGFELEVLEGAYKTLKENMPVICIEEILPELEDSEPINFLIQLNYKVVDRINKEVILKMI